MLQLQQDWNLCEDCRELHKEVHQYLKKHAAAARGRGRGRARGRGRGGPGVAAISIAEVQSMVDSLSNADSAFLPDKWLIDSGSDINICYNYDLFSYIGPSDIEMCTQLSSTPLPVQGKGVAKMCVGNYMDHMLWHMHTMHAWLIVQMLWQMHGRTMQAVHKLFVCMRIF